MFFFIFVGPFPWFSCFIRSDIESMEILKFGGTRIVPCLAEYQSEQLKNGPLVVEGFLGDFFLASSVGIAML